MSKLILVPTPIGNLEDITLRAINCLKSCDHILAEDTRTSAVLLKHYEINKKAIPYHQHNEHKVTQQIIENLKSGLQYCLITDAGSPGISDPGFFIVRACVENGIEVEALPGATAFVPALTVSGFASDSFCFEGFLPIKKGRQKKLSQLIEEKRTIIFYESPHRIVKTVGQLMEYFGEERKVCVIKEISKIHETKYRGSLKEVFEMLNNEKIRGEFVIVLEGKN
jgi:16S rRNA (cytidine1402-2'-O)-methyltransferase